MGKGNVNIVFRGGMQTALHCTQVPIYGRKEEEAAERRGRRRRKEKRRRNKKKGAAQFRVDIGFGFPWTDILPGLGAGYAGGTPRKPNAFDRFRRQPQQEVHLRQR